MKRAALSLATAIGAVLAFGPATAWADGETILSYSGNPMAGSSITVTAAPGRVNNLSEGFPINQGASIAIQDTAGLLESPDTPNCNQVSTTQVNCLAEGLSSASIFSGDLDDALAINDTTEANIEFHIFTGTGPDRANVILSGVSGNALSSVNTGPGPDTVTARFTTNEPANSEILLPNYALGPGPDTARISGPARASGQGGRDKLFGGKGNQKFSGGPQKDRIACGKGNKDRANGGGAADQIAPSCERIVSA